MIIWLKALVEVLIDSVSSDITSAEFRASLTGIGTLKGFEKTYSSISLTTKRQPTTLSIRHYLTGARLLPIF
jgi:hypothetical protein